MAEIRRKCLLGELSSEEIIALQSKSLKDFTYKGVSWIKMQEEVNAISLNSFKNEEGALKKQTDNI